MLLFGCTRSETPPDTPAPEDTVPGDDTDVVVDTPDDTAGLGPDTAVSCDYPAGAVEPMALGEVLTPYAWPRALHADGRDLPLRLERVPCAVDPDIDWSPFDLLLFVSVPAW